MSPEEKLEALMLDAEIPTEVAEKLLPEGALDRLRAAGFDVSSDVWGDPVARPPYETGYYPIATCIEFLDLVGDEAVAAIDAVALLRSRAEARAYRDELVARALRERRKGRKRG